jgi:hypothetical protein
MLGDETLHGVPAEPVPAIADEQGRGAVVRPPLQPDAEGFHAVFPEWSGSLLS